jgi:dTMP kinase
MSKKPIIVFEGIESSGKTLHINNIARYLKKINVKFIKIREPGGSKNAEKIRKIILNNKSNFNKYTDLLLYMASRSENVEKIIKKNYRKKIILIDRFIDSTLAYQHYGMGINKKLIINLNEFILNKIKPDFIFLNVVNKENLIQRLNKRLNKNRYDKFKFNFYNKVQKGFLKIAKNKNNYLIINSNNEIQYNKNLILKKIKKLI